MPILIYVGVVSLPRTPDRGLLSVPIPGRTASGTSRCSESHGVCATVCMCVCVLLVCVCVCVISVCVCVFILCSITIFLITCSLLPLITACFRYVSLFTKAFPCSLPLPSPLSLSLTSYVLHACITLCG